MLLTIQQAADTLGKTARQVRYLIQQGKLDASKLGGQWLIDSGQLPRSSKQQRAAERKQRMLADAVEDALELPPASARRRYSVRDLRAFKIAAPLFADVAAALGEDHVVARELRLSLDALASGCHRYDSPDKASAYRTARDHASRAACELALMAQNQGPSETEDDKSPAERWLDCIEQELMAAMAGLLRRLQRPRRSA